MEKIRRQLNEKVNQVNEFNITFEKAKKEVAKKKGWTVPVIDGILNYWWQKLEPIQKALKRAFTKVKEYNTNIPTWWLTGRTVLLPKTKNLEDEKNYRLMTCLNTSYKIMTGVVEKYMREYVMESDIWNEGQLEAIEGVLGIVDQLIVDQCIMEEVKQYHRNLAVAFYNYKKVHNKVHHDWMLSVYQWIGIPDERIKLNSNLMDFWKTRLEIWRKVESMTNHDTGACFGVSGRAEIMFKRGKIVMGEGLEVLKERMKTMDLDKNEIYKFLEIDQADRIKTKKVFERVKGEVNKRVKILTNTELNYENLVCAINTKVVPVEGYPMNVCKFTVRELKERD